MTKVEAVLKGLEISGLSKSAFARSIGVSRNQIYNWIKKVNTDVYVSNVEAVARIIGKKVHWLNYEQTECEFVDYLPGEELPPSPDLPQGARWEPPDLKTKPIPVIAMVSAGTSDFFSEEGYPVGVGDEYITRPYDLKDITAYGLRISVVQGDSMERVLRPDDVVICSPVATVKNNDMVVVKLKNDAVMVKEIQFKGDKILLHSLNSHYESMEYDKDEIAWYHKVVHIKKK